MPSNHTQNYQLSQWVRSDQVKMEDFNADNAKIDRALAAHTEQLAKLPFCGNCQIYVTSYQGDGNYSENFGENHPNSLTFPRKPAWVVIFSPDGRTQFNIFPDNITYGFGTTSRDYTVHITWNGNTVTWYANDVHVQMNFSSYTYHVIAFCPLD